MMKNNSGDFVEYISFYEKYYECLEVHSYFSTFVYD